MHTRKARGRPSRDGQLEPMPPSCRIHFLLSQARKGTGGKLFGCGRKHDLDRQLKDIALVRPIAQRSVAPPHTSLATSARPSLHRWARARRPRMMRASGGATAQQRIASHRTPPRGLAHLAAGTAMGECPSYGRWHVAGLHAFMQTQIGESQAALIRKAGGER